MEYAARIAQKLAALKGLGFERVETYPVATESLRVGPNRHQITSSRPAMGTLVAVTAIHHSVDLIEDVIGRAFIEMDRVVAILNRYDTASAVASLNAESVIEGSPWELSHVVKGALDYHRLSGGAFDVTVQPLVDLFRQCLRQDSPSGVGGASEAAACGSEKPEPPTERQMLEALALVDAGKLEISERTIRLHKPGMGITLDGIAKGFVVDRLAGFLSEQGLTDFLINAGGDIRTAGRRGDGQLWRVAVQDPAKNEDFPDIVELSAGAVATSGSYEIYFDPERTYHHLVSSRSGSSPQETASVSVIAPSTMAADALATSVFVMGADRGIAFIDSLPQCACLVVDRNGSQLRSRRWRGTMDTSQRKAGA